VLNDEDEKFLQRLVSSDHGDGPPPPLPPRPKTPDLTWDSDSDSVRLAQTDKPTTTTTKKPSPLSRLFHRKTSSSSSNALTVPDSRTTVAPDEADREWADLNRVLSRLGIEPSTTTDVQTLLRQFVLVLKDITNGAPTAVDDLVQLLDGRNDVLKRGFEKLPGSMQRLVTQLPKKLTSSLGPEVLAAAAEAQGLKGETDAAGLARFLMPKNLQDLVLTPAIVKSMLSAIVNALKLRWPAFVGTNMLWS
ncbi:hypothetical protein N658DRAFT_410075, partial [Parathielavia hyrcaniae]